MRVWRVRCAACLCRVSHNAHSALFAVRCALASGLHGDRDRDRRSGISISIKHINHKMLMTMAVQCNVQCALCLCSCLWMLVSQIEDRRHSRLPLLLAHAPSPPQAPHATHKIPGQMQMQMQMQMHVGNSNKPPATSHLTDTDTGTNFIFITSFSLLAIPAGSRAACWG